MDSAKALEAVKQLDLLTVMQHFGVDYPLHRSHIKCPFGAHNATGRTPSFKFYPDTNSFYCFGCKRAGSPVDFVLGMWNTHQSELPKAVKFLVETFDVKLESSILTKVAARNVVCKDEFTRKFAIISFITHVQTIPSEQRMSLFDSLFKLFLKQAS